MNTMKNNPIIKQVLDDTKVRRTEEINYPCLKAGVCNTSLLAEDLHTIDCLTESEKTNGSSDTKI